jgi:hypothetical protein
MHHNTNAVLQNYCREKLWAITLLSAFLLPINSSAQAYLDMGLEELLSVTIKGSTLRDESLKTAPSSVTVFTREQLDALGLDYLHELMNLVPGFQTTRGADSPINYTFSARGRRLGVRAREILLVVDGRVFADARSSGADSAVSLYPLANIERIEIIRGPGSAIYGSNAFTGVINIDSRRNQKRFAVAAAMMNGVKRISIFPNPWVRLSWIFMPMLTRIKGRTTAWLPVQLLPTPRLMTLARKLCSILNSAMKIPACNFLIHSKKGKIFTPWKK